MRSSMVWRMSSNIRDEQSRSGCCAHGESLLGKGGVGGSRRSIHLMVSLELTDRQTNGRTDGRTGRQAGRQAGGQARGRTDGKPASQILTHPPTHAHTDLSTHPPIHTHTDEHQQAHTHNTHPHTDVHMSICTHA